MNYKTNESFSMVTVAVDDRCDMELDETDPTIWMKLESAVDEYIQKNHQALESVCEKLLLPFQHEENWSENIKVKQLKTMASNEGTVNDMFSVCHLLNFDLWLSQFSTIITSPFCFCRCQWPHVRVEAQCTTC